MADAFLHCRSYRFETDFAWMGVSKSMRVPPRLKYNPAVPELYFSLVPHARAQMNFKISLLRRARGPNEEKVQLFFLPGDHSLNKYATIFWLGFLTKIPESENGGWEPPLSLKPPFKGNFFPVWMRTGSWYDNAACSTSTTSTTTAAAVCGCQVVLKLFQ